MDTRATVESRRVTVMFPEHPATSGRALSPYPREVLGTTAVALGGPSPGCSGERER